MENSKPRQSTYDRMSNTTDVFGWLQGNMAAVVQSVQLILFICAELVYMLGSEQSQLQALVL